LHASKSVLINDVKNKEVRYGEAGSKKRSKLNARENNDVQKRKLKVLQSKS